MRTWLALLALLALTCGTLLLLSMGQMSHVVVNFASLRKALLVALVFMRLRIAAPMIVITAIAGFVWLSFLFGLTAIDYATRGF